MRILLYILFPFVMFGQAEYKTQPNIILVLLDDLGYKEAMESVSMRANDNSWIEPMNVPHMRSRYNGRALEFTNFYASPICTPSRTQMWTGKSLDGNYQRFVYYDDDIRTFANELQWNGYSTAIFGKIQRIVDNPTSNVNQLTVSPITYNEVDGLQWVLNAGYDEGLVNEIYTITGSFMTKYYDCVDGTYLTLDSLNACQSEVYTPNMEYDAIIDYIDRKKGNCNPFLVDWRMFLPHSPYQPTPNHPDYPSNTVNDARYYPAMVTYADNLINDLVNYVDADPELSKGAGTAIVIMADNGTQNLNSSTKFLYTDSTEGNGGKSQSTPHGTHVPAFALYFGNHDALDDNTIYDAPVGLVDIYGTVLDLAKLDNYDKKDSWSFADEIVTYIPNRPNRACLTQYYNMFWQNLGLQRGGTNFNTYTTDGTYWYDSYDRFYQNSDRTLSMPIIPTSTAEQVAYGKLKFANEKLPKAQDFDKILYPSN